MSENLAGVFKIGEPSRISLIGIAGGQLGVLNIEIHTLGGQNLHICEPSGTPYFIRL